MKIHFDAIQDVSHGVLAIGVNSSLELSDTAKALDDTTGQALTRAIKQQQFKGKHKDTCIIAVPGGTELDAIILLGVGDADDYNATKAEQLGGKLYATLLSINATEASAIVEEGGNDAEKLQAHLVHGSVLRSYRFDKYRTQEKEEDLPSLQSITALGNSADASSAEFQKLQAIANGVFLTRDVVTEPPNKLYPATYAERCQDLTSLGLEVDVLGEEELDRLGMGALLGVGQGSHKDSKLVVMQWKGAPDGSNQDPIAFVGKGVTFDTGGISLKPSGGMEDMKYDMGGSGVVVGLMKALAGRKAAVNVVGVIGLVENMPGSNAQRPSDVVTSMSGQTIEVLNTDAEGRLVLADALWYCQDRFKPRFMIDLATLTGAITIALGDAHCGLFSNDDTLSEQITEAGLETEEKVWRFPLGKEYDKLLDSPIADMQNISAGRGAGSITAAQFLQRFVNDTPWAHLDIAGVTWSKKDRDLSPKGATSFGVRLLNELVAKHYEA